MGINLGVVVASTEEVLGALLEEGLEGTRVVGTRLISRTLVGLAEVIEVEVTGAEVEVIGAEAKANRVEANPVLQERVLC